MPYGSKLHIPPTNYHLLAAQQEPYKKSLITLNEKCLRVFWREQSQENGPLAEKWQDRKSKRTRQRKQERQERGIKWQPWYSRQEGPLRHPRPSFGGQSSNKLKKATNIQTQNKQNRIINNKINSEQHSDFKLHIRTQINIRTHMHPCP